MPKPIMDLWVTSSSEEEEEEETTPPPKIKKSTKTKSAPPKSITRTTKVKPSKRATRRDEVEDEDEDEYGIDTKTTKKGPYNDHISIERESRIRDGKNRPSDRSRDSRDRDWSADYGDRGHDRKAEHINSKTSITKIHNVTPASDYRPISANDDSLSTRKTSAMPDTKKPDPDEGHLCGWIDIKCILFFIFIISATCLGFVIYLFYCRLKEEMMLNATNTTVPIIQTTVSPSVDLGADEETTQAAIATTAAPTITAAITPAATTPAATTAAAEDDGG